VRIRDVLSGAVLVAALAGCTQPGAPGGGGTPPSERVVGYFTDWGVYGRGYQVKDVETTGAAARLTHLVYAFGSVAGGRCAISDGWADYQKPVPAQESVDGRADTGDAVRGTIGQLRRLKARLDGAGRAAVARALGEPDVAERSSVEDCEGWTYRVGGGRLLVVMYGGRNCWLIHHPE